MAINIDGPIQRKPLRLWPGVVIVLLQFLARFVVPAVAPEFMVYGVLGGLAGGFAVLVWWLFFSRALWLERVGAVLLMVVALLASFRVVHESISTGAMGMLLPLLAVPVLSIAFVAWAVASRHLPDGLRRATMVATILLACGSMALIRTGGFTGSFSNDLHWRWSATPEERLLAQGGDTPAPSSVARPEVETPGKPDATHPSDEPALALPRVVATTTLAHEPIAAAEESSARPADPTLSRNAADWPAFRGPARDGIVHGVQIQTDWSRNPPVELWRHSIGPGWSSFAVHGNLFYTQEQRGDDEIVSAYDLRTGEPVWRHRDAARFWESNGGAGPRGTPTLDRGRLYTFGATGIVNALDAGSGAVIWSRNAASETEVKIPGWGFASSPLVVDDVVIIAVAGKLVAYDAATGAPRWTGPGHEDSYSSPHLATIDGVTQVLMLSGGGVTSVAPATGTVLWDQRMGGNNIVQPALTAEGDVLVGAIDSSASGVGTRRLAVAHGPGGWTVEERWTSTGLKPAFNDYVVHKGHAFGFDGSILACIDLKDGARRWKGGRYGNGQLVLLPDQDVLLVVTEDGELALVGATPDQFRELARFPAIEGKTWNHPALAGDVLLVRNGEEMAAFRLSLASR